VAAALRQVLHRLIRTFESGSRSDAELGQELRSRSSAQHRQRDTCPVPIGFAWVGAHVDELARISGVPAAVPRWAIAVTASALRCLYGSRSSAASRETISGVANALPGFPPPRRPSIESLDLEARLQHDQESRFWLTCRQFEIREC